MKKKFYFLYLALFLLAAYACKREYMDQHNEEERLHNPTIALDVKLARSYFAELRAEQGEVVQTDNSKAVMSTSGKVNKKYVLFDKAYAGSTDAVSFVESPLVYNKRSATIFQGKQSSDDVTQQEIQQLNSSFDRLVIFKDNKTGKIDQRIISYIPDLAYLQKHHFDASKNKITQLESDYSGYIIYKGWDEKVLSVLKVVNGKGVRRFTPRTGASINDIQNSKKTTSGLKTTGQVCEPVYNYTYTQQCYYSDPEHTQNESCGEWVLTGQTYAGYDDCHDDGTGSPNPCNQPYNFDPSCNNHTCDNCGAGDSGGGSSPDIHQDIVLRLDDICLISAINIVRNPANTHNSIGKLINDNFASNATFDIEFYETDTLSNSRMANTTQASFSHMNAAGDSVFSIKIILNKNILPNASQEFVSITVLHECLHAYFEYKKVLNGDAYAQHVLMSTKYVDLMSASVISAYPNIDPASCKALIMSEMADVYNKSPSDFTALLSYYGVDLNNYSNIISNYKSGSQGTACTH